LSKSNSKGAVGGKWDDDDPLLPIIENRELSCGLVLE